MPRHTPSSADVQGDLFASDAAAADNDRSARQAAAPPPPAAPRIAAAPPNAAIEQLAARLHAAFGGRLYLGTSSWSFPGWSGLVWDGRAHSDADLSRHGLTAYS
jgi:hypothetical protein